MYYCIIKVIKVRKVNFLLQDNEAVEVQAAMGSVGTEENVLKMKEFTN